jgi:hypothetical protein
VLDDKAIKGCLMINAATELASPVEEARQRLQAMLTVISNSFIKYC